MPMEEVSTAAGQRGRLCAPGSGEAWRFGGAQRIEALLLMVAGIFFALHFVHLKADFPNHSPWMDWAKYTDEGWYGDAAIRHYELGHWYVPGDFNPAAALPVWPVLELALFRATGVSVTAARALTVAVFGLNLVLGYLLIRRWSPTTIGLHRRSWAPAIAVVLLAVSPFCFVFSRLAILEPLLILFTLAALLAASWAGQASAQTDGLSGDRASRFRFGTGCAAMGLLLTLIVLTKTTGVFLFPAIFWILWAAAEYRVKPFAVAAGLACSMGLAAWGLYYLLFVRPHYRIDYGYLFSANAYTGITFATFWQVIGDALLDLSWMGETLFVLVLFAVVASAAGVAVRRRRENPLAVALLLWTFGYGAFLAYHANLQPRYYVVIAVPLTMLTAVVFDWLMVSALERKMSAGVGHWLIRSAAAAAGAALLFAAASGAVRTLGFVMHPEYGWWDAAQQVRAVVDGEAQATGGVGHSRLVLSISGSDLSLMTGVPSICDDFGTMPLAERVAVYRPGWFASWNDVEDDKMEALAPLYRLERVAAIPAFDDPERNLLILYRLDPLSTPGPRGGTGRRRFLSVPRRLRTRVGEQPSAVQLRH